MKLSLNGALTIGTLDGANVEIREEVGAENFFLFGLTVEEIARLKAAGYKPRDIYSRNLELREVLDFVTSGSLAGGDTQLFRPIVDTLLEKDSFFVLADYESYLECQQRVNTLWQDRREWSRRSILNTARMAHFSSDRSIRDYCEKIWGVIPMRVS